MAARLDGSSDALTRTTNLPGITALTMMAWIKMSVTRSTYNGFLSIGKNDGSNFYFGGTSSDNTSQMTWNGSAQKTSGGTSLSIGTWYHAAITVAGTGAGQFNYYINGANVISDSGNASITAAKMWFGGDEAGDWLNGCVENALAYSAALTQAEIQQQMWQRMPIRTANLNGWYPLLSDSKDYSGNGYDLTEGGTITWEAGPGVGWRRGRSRVIFPAPVIGGGGGTTRGTPFGHRGTAFNGGRTFHGIIQ